MLILVAFTVGFALASLQFAQHYQPRINHDVTANITGALIKINGNADARSRLWIKLDAGLFRLDWLVAPLMTTGLHALYHLADWVAGVPLAGWKVVPSGYVVLFVMMTGMMISQLLTKPMARIDLLLVAIGGVIWAFRPVPYGVLFAVGRTPQLLLATSNGAAQSYIALFDFLASMAELRMGKGIEQVDQAQCLPARKHDFPNGISASIVMKAKGLTAACKDLETAFVLTSVTPRYPYFSGKLFYGISQKQDIVI